MRNSAHPVLEATSLSAVARPRNHACTKNSGCLSFSRVERTCSGNISRLPWRCSLARRRASAIMLPSDSKGRSGFLLSLLIGSLASCVPWIANHSAWRTSSGVCQLVTMMIAGAPNWPKLSRINSVRYNRRVRRMFQRRSAMDGFLYHGWLLI